ncbi:protein of unknown function [endosymbiont DhMRE of Dentiscutata heterogama]|uniref:hypothetical protein n=1 Tax=endosymbiont DhMRE of Dentiscutata heterogama TaxID=1609546 RepID=UPI00063622DE|nr:hypothetical protein [endosymbiont DhMRE of Dentiscutata heterogama]CFW92716.1 protein of unknown function [endosymbiont DhMRE of Dentiscutata heterogama]
MVKENLIPATEIVAELKDEYKVPSYEEFLKNYKSDSNLNYNDLSGGEVWESEGYGPCVYKKSHCKCSCPRSDCNCEDGERYIKLYMPCPADGCGNTSRSNWVHSTDSCYIWISNHANIRCEKSYCTTNLMSNWRFKCSNHSFHKGEYSRASFSTWTDVVTTAGKLWGDDDLILDLLIWLRKPENKRKF